MIPGRIADSTRVLGKSQGYLGLPVRDDVIVVDGQDVPIIKSAWFPTDAEIAALRHGAPVYMTIMGEAQPPVVLTVGTKQD